MLRLWILMVTLLAMLEAGVIPGHRATPANDGGTAQAMDGGVGSPPPPPHP